MACVDLILASCALQRLTEEDLPGAAGALLEEGWDSPSLQRLAAWTSENTTERDWLWNRAREELALPLPLKPVAIRTIGRHWLERFLADEVNCAELASGLRADLGKAIIWDTPEIHGVYYNADEVGPSDDPFTAEAGAGYERAAREYASRLLTEWDQK